MARYSLLVLAVFTVSLTTSAPAIAERGDSPSLPFNFKLPAFPASVFNEQMQAFFALPQNAVVGYQVVVVRKHQIVATLSGGYADLQNGLPMQTTHKANIGSVMKFLTGALVYRAANYRAAVTGKTIDQVLDEPVLNYLPGAFADHADSTVWEVSFRDLLGHRTNWFTNSDFPSTYLADGVNMLAHVFQKYTYQNANFSLLSYAIPGLYYPTLKVAIDVICQSSVSCGRKQLGKQFGTLVRQQLEDQLQSGPLRGSCYAPNLAAGLSLSAFAVNYVRPSAPGPGVIYDERPHLGHCHGAGGWHYSAEDLAQFLINLESNSYFMDHDVFESWAEPTQPGYEQTRLVWPARIDSNYFLTNWGWQSLPFSGGDHGFPDANGNNAEAHAAIVKFPLDYYAIAIVNSDRDQALRMSPGWGSRQIAIGLEDAMAQAFQQMFP